jgi:hypothetical protein
LKKNAIIIFLFASTLCIGFITGQENEESYYYERIANPDETLNFVFGFYPEKFSWHESKDSKYTSIPAAVINQPKAKPLAWRDYKVYIMLKDGTLFNSYTTVAKTGKFACQYTVQPGDKHYQHFNFSKKFKPQQILHIWLKLTDGNFIKLLYKI